VNLWEQSHVSHSVLQAACNATAELSINPLARNIGDELLFSNTAFFFILLPPILFYSCARAACGVGVF
jgi:hypothetical protein